MDHLPMVLEPDLLLQELQLAAIHLQQDQTTTEMVRM
jgi:hypothetical protein